MHSCQCYGFIIGVYKVVLDYLNKYCKRNEEKQRSLLEFSCSLLQRTCRNNPKVSMKMGISITVYIALNFCGQIFS